MSDDQAYLGSSHPGEHNDVFPASNNFVRYPIESNSVALWRFPFRDIIAPLVLALVTFHSQRPSRPSSDIPQFFLLIIYF